MINFNLKNLTVAKLDETVQRMITIKIWGRLTKEMQAVLALTRVVLVAREKNIPLAHVKAIDASLIILGTWMKKPNPRQEARWYLRQSLVKLGPDTKHNSAVSKTFRSIILPTPYHGEWKINLEKFPENFTFNNVTLFKGQGEAKVQAQANVSSSKSKFPYNTDQVQAKHTREHMASLLIATLVKEYEAKYPGQFTRENAMNALKILSRSYSSRKGYTNIQEEAFAKKVTQGISKRLRVGAPQLIMMLNNHVPTANSPKVDNLPQAIAPQTNMNEAQTLLCYQLLTTSGVLSPEAERVMQDLGLTRDEICSRMIVQVKKMDKVSDMFVKVAQVIGLKDSREQGKE